MSPALAHVLRLSVCVMVGFLALPALAEKAPQVLRDCPDCPEMIVMPGGTFTMGSPSGELARYDVEGPQHDVRVAPFALGKYEVTRGEWGAFVRESGYQQPETCDDEFERDWRRAGFPQTDRHPVVCVSWKDAHAYVEWLSRKTAKTYRLPSEAEWEYAARAGSKIAYYWGDDPRQGCRYENGFDVTSQRTLKPRPADFATQAFNCDDGFVHTAPVGSFAANPFGLHDMLGNVAEWVEDCWHSNYSGAPTDAAAWTSGGDCGRRVIRGGSWDGAPRSLRVAVRREDSVAFGRDRHSVMGFRLARSLD